MSFRFGLIGCGRIAGSHVSALAKFPQVILFAVSDPIMEHMDRIEAQVERDHLNSGSLKKYTDYRELLLNPDIDVVIIASSTGTHAEIAKQALVAGKHVVLEKPMALSVSEAMDIISLAEATGKTLLICHQMRYRPILRKMKELIEQGSLGEIYYGKVHLRLHRSKEYFLDSPWRGTWAEDGGMLLNQGIHMVDLLVWMLGDVKEVYGIVTRRSDIKEIEDAALGILTFEHQRYGVIEANTISCPHNVGYELSLFGEKGTIILSGPTLNHIVRWQIQDDPIADHELEQLLQDGDDRVYMYQDLLDSLENARPVFIDAKGAYKSLEAIFGVYHSSLFRLPIPFPLRSFSTVWMGKGNESLTKYWLEGD